MCLRIRLRQQMRDLDFVADILTNFTRHAVNKASHVLHLLKARLLEPTSTGAQSKPYLLGPRPQCLLPHRFCATLLHKPRFAVLYPTGSWVSSARLGVLAADEAPQGTAAGQPPHGGAIRHQTPLGLQQTAQAAGEGTEKWFTHFWKLWGL